MKQEKALRRDVAVRQSFARKRNPVKIDCGEGLTEQSHQDECDINFILRDGS